ncbi:hypothetical protein [Pedobacter zeae]|uniref:Uncharacterized protein n=1 Tax=Pedobacter zeae TaxID=1737356 RepID=A0A7W6K6N5_9SPHI|nr:hypothetical protein [Pedobacter zeae]MBB4106169.1 hypothetical protein [Pedobacter zeae]GGG99912.1 hypothetical protein GCM10007422_12990 [Pedobacter zeae]
MVKDTLNSMLDNIKERTTNPFLGTLLVVWIIRNWTLVYGLFNFDKGFTLDKKLKYIADHYQSQAFVPNLLIVVAITFLVLVSTYCMLTLGRLITDTYDKFVIPYLAKITDKSSIVLKTEYKALEEVVKQLEIRLEEERLAKVSAQSERDKSDEKLFKYLNPSPELQTNGVTDELDSTFKRIEKRFQDEESRDNLNSTLSAIQTKRSLPKGGATVSLLAREGLIQVTTIEINNPGMAFFEFTDEGRKFLRRWNSINS